MNFMPSRRSGRYWDDAKLLHKCIKSFNFVVNAQREKEFENMFAASLDAHKDKFQSELVSQTNKETTVQSIRCFGKNHRPDMTFDKNGIAIEIKLSSYSGLTKAIGQGHIYRLSYRFAFLIIILTKDKKGFYQEFASNGEPLTESLLQYLADEMNIFTYIVPSFKVGTAVKNRYSFFEKTNLY
ncbi:hypothetical protein [Marinicella sp. W31]|uniref:hypothetical protein n=1 Tax=Marinicella sp. W31 TaxID=3023713 RepID=UPI0037583596